MDSALDRLQRRFEQISPAPRVANSIRALVAAGNINPDEIISLIRLEPLLAARILREANQLPEAAGQGYASVEDAATAVGFQRMYDLLGLYAFPSAESAGAYTTERWKRAVTCAACMESLAAKHKLDTHEAYAIGLLHSLAPALADGEAPDAPVACSGAYRNRLRQFNGAGLTYALLSDWSLPRRLLEPIRFQYTPLDCQSTGKMACLLHLAKWVTGVIREIDELPDQALGPDVLVLNLLGEGEQTLWNLVAEVSDRLVEADALLHGKRADSAC